MSSTPTVQIVSVTLEPYRNGDDLFDRLKILALAPGQKVADDYGHMVSAGAIWLSGLYFSKSVHVRPEDYAQMIDNARVLELPEYMRYSGNEPVTSAADVAEVRTRCKRIVDLARERLTEAHPDYKPTFNDVVYLSPEEAAKYCHPLQLPRPDESKLTCFEDWLRAVDYRLMNKFGVTSSDLEDYSWHDLCGDGYSPREAVAAFCEDTGYSE